MTIHHQFHTNAPSSFRLHLKQRQFEKQFAKLEIDAHSWKTCKRQTTLQSGLHAKFLQGQSRLNQSFETERRRIKQLVKLRGIPS